MDYVSQELQGKGGTPEQAQRREGLCLNTAMVGLCSARVSYSSARTQELLEGSFQKKSDWNRIHHELWMHRWKFHTSCLVTACPALKK